MDPIITPSKIAVLESSKDFAKIVVEPCYPGYGTTLGNALRRVLLSSLPGSAITAVKIEGVDHEFSALPFVKEDVVTILLNLKQLRFKLFEEASVTLTLNVKGERVATGADFAGPSAVEVVNLKQPIATLTDKAARLAMEVIVDKGRGYVPVENREKDKLDVGWIAVDAVYTPVKTVNFSIEHVRVGQITNYDRLVLTVETDGTIKPEDAVSQSARILVEHFTSFENISESVTPETPKKKRTRTKKEPTDAATPTEEAKTETTTDLTDAAS